MSEVEVLKARVQELEKEVSRLEGALDEMNDSYERLHAAAESGEDIHEAVYGRYDEEEVTTPERVLDTTTSTQLEEDINNIIKRLEESTVEYTLPEED